MLPAAASARRFNHAGLGSFYIIVLHKQLNA